MNAERLKNVLELLTKFFVALAGTFYISGYVITAILLNQYGVPATRLADIQYFVAGMIPGILIWVTAFVAILAWSFHPYIENEDSRFSSTPRWTIANVIFYSLFGIMIITSLLFPVVTGIEWEDTNLGRALLIGLGELGLWIFIVVIKNWRSVMEELEEFLRVMKKDIFAQTIGFLSMRIIFPILFAGLAIIYARSLIWEFYLSIPPAYGGGKSLQVVLIVDENDVPEELLSYETSSGSDSKSRTVPLNLIFRASSEYVVTTIDTDNQTPGENETKQAWMIDAGAVYSLTTFKNESEK